MIYNKLLLALAISAGIFDVAFATPKFGGGAGGFQGKGAGAQASGVAAATGVAGAAAASGAAASTAAANAATSTGTSTGAADLELNPANVQTGSEANGIGASGAESGQAASATDPANFINFCTGKTLTNGLQVKGGSCNGIAMGDIPASTDMVSTIITNPQAGDSIAANQDFNVNLQVANLQAGSFTDPDVTYYAAPQALKNGQVIGHTHVTIQTLGDSLNPTTAPDPATFAFFKGINDAGNGQGGLSATVTGGLPAGSYRVCTMSSASNHQPVLMPVAQRGAQDDCTKFTVGGAGAAGNGTVAAASTVAGAASATGAAASTASSAAAGTAGTGATGATGATGGKGAGRGFGGRGRHRYVARAIVA